MCAHQVLQYYFIIFLARILYVKNSVITNLIYLILIKIKID